MRRTALGRPARRAAILPGVGKAGGADLVDAIDIVAGSASFGKTTLVRVFDLDAGIDTAAEKVAGRLSCCRPRNSTERLRHSWIPQDHRKARSTRPSITSSLARDTAHSL